MCRRCVALYEHFLLFTNTSRLEDTVLHPQLVIAAELNLSKTRFLSEHVVLYLAYLDIQVLTAC